MRFFVTLPENFIMLEIPIRLLCISVQSSYSSLTIVLRFIRMQVRVRIELMQASILDYAGSVYVEAASATRYGAVWVMSRKVV